MEEAFTSSAMQESPPSPCGQAAARRPGGPATSPAARCRPSLSEFLETETRENLRECEAVAGLDEVHKGVTHVGELLALLPALGGDIAELVESSEAMRVQLLHEVLGRDSTRDVDNITVVTGVDQFTSSADSESEQHSESGHSVELSAESASVLGLHFEPSHHRAE
eukprot:CAMPEP_0170598166 /NCGR_PEP_ID=MMETSP0224-20130122/16099_1 /TAXON_ID=285029 /ORGANISM="Togula jolla, Strain CCCM 725" /LENGTH=165 /DNA_ID=CAMNT_0010922693 /DNA_START=195 /DNA_END=695 /DNA_ORIENTATION=+